MAPIEFGYALDDYENEDRAKWERTRLEIFYIVNTSMGIKKPYKHPGDLIPFDWDKPGEKIEFSEDYEKRIRERDKKVFKFLKEQKDGIKNA